MEEVCNANVTPHKHPHTCHDNLWPPRFSSPVVFIVSASTSFPRHCWPFRGLGVGALAVPRPPRCPTLWAVEGGGSAVCPVQLSPSVSLPLLFKTSCRWTSGEAVPIDTWLPQTMGSCTLCPQQTHAGRKRRLQFTTFTHTDKSLNSSNGPQYFTLHWSSGFTNLDF